MYSTSKLGLRYFQCLHESLNIDSNRWDDSNMPMPTVIN